MLADVDGTLVTNDKILTEPRHRGGQGTQGAGVSSRSRAAGRRGMIDAGRPLELTTPFAAFNGGVFVRPDMSVIEQHTIPDDITPAR